MDQIHNHYSGPITVQGANYQSHYVPAEKPYAVYAFVWEGPIAEIAQLIGTMLVGKVNEEGNMVFDGKPVYRMLDKNGMLDFQHCFIPDDMGELENDPIHLGFVGDTVGKDELVEVVWMGQKDGDDINVKRFLDNIQIAGLKVELGDDLKMQEVTGCIDVGINHTNGKREFFLGANDEIALRVMIWNSDDKSENSLDAVGNLWYQIKKWQEVGATFERIKMKDGDADYQNLVDELVELAKLYGEYEKKQTSNGQLYKLLKCRDVIGTGRCLYDDFVMGLKKFYWDSYSDYDEDLEEAISAGLVSREGNIIQFTPDLERMATWQWKWKRNEK